MQKMQKVFQVFPKAHFCTFCISVWANWKDYQHQRLRLAVVGQTVFLDTLSAF
jgi:hypothetical protein